MNGWLLDTNIVAEISGRRCDPTVEKWLSQLPEQALYLSILTFGEYHKGIAHLPEDDPLRLRVLTQLQGLRDRFQGRILGLNEECLIIWGAMANRAKRMKGHPSPVIDTLFATQAKQGACILATRNVRDVQDCGVDICNPWDLSPTP